MRKIIYLTGIVVALLILNAQMGFAQESKIVLFTDVAKYEASGSYITYSELKSTLSKNPEARLYLDKYKSGKSGGQVLGVIGGGLIGWPLGTALAGGDPKWFLLGVGAGVAVIGLAIESSANKNLQKSVDVYNESNGFTSQKKELLMPVFVLTPTKIGIDVRF